MRAVNLLPREEQPRSFAAMRGVAFGAAGGIALVTVTLTALMIGAGGSIQQQNAERDALNAQLAALPHAAVDQQESDTNAALASEKNLRVTALSTALSTRVAWDRVLSQISQVLPEDVWLTSLTSAAGETADSSTTTGAVGPPGASVTLVGSTYSQRGVARFLARLGVIPALSGVHLLSSSNVDLKPRDLVQFTIQATVKAPGASQ
jgi:Tfp pilus assembly protein PilN